MITSQSAMWKVQPKSQIHLLDLNRLSKKITSRSIRSTTPFCVVGAGVVGILSGAGVTAYLRIFAPVPTTIRIVAT